MVVQAFNSQHWEEEVGDLFDFEASLVYIASSMTIYRVKSSLRKKKKTIKIPN